MPAQGPDRNRGSRAVCLALSGISRTRRAASQGNQDGPVILVREANSLVFQMSPRKQATPAVGPSGGSGISHLQYQHGLSILDPVDAGVFVLDHDWRLLHVSGQAAQMLGHNGHLQGKVIWEEFPDLTGSELFAHLRFAAQHRRTCKVVVRWGNRRWVKLDVYPAVAGLCVFSRFISAAEQSRAKRLQAALRKQVQAAEENERQHIGRELHDGAGQLVAALAVGLRSVEEALTFQQAKEVTGQLRSVVSRLSDELAFLTRRLHPSVLHERGLVNGLRSFLPEFRRLHGIRVLLIASELKGLQLDETVQLGLFRIVQEALANVAKHSGATRAEVVFRRSARRLHLTVRDNGSGLVESGRGRDTGVRLGWHSMRARAENLGGKLKVHSTPGRGVAVQVGIPIAGTT